MYKDTIAAISTAVSQSGIGIIRISGEEAFSVIDKIYCSPGGKKKLSRKPSHTVHYGYIRDGEELIDEVLVTIMRAPRTFTAEDTVEINCHGGIYAMKRVLETVLKNGARPAMPGEFTKRAFLNGRIDLSRAEAVIDVIQAKNEYALKSSLGQLRGSLQKAIEEVRREILHEIARIEAALDDPEHMSLEGYGEALLEKNRKWMEKLQKLIDSSENGRLIREGVKTAIVGKPNAGKSSLLNFLLGEERAIVTEVEGTTRDILTETVQMGGITLNVADTAGIRDTQDQVEKIGVERARKNALEADLIIYVTDSSRKLDENDRAIMEMLQGKKVIILLNKTDLEPVTSEKELEACKKEWLPQAPVLPVSAKKEEGMELLEKTVREMFYQGKISFNDEVYITNARHKNLLTEARESLEQVENSIQSGMPEDFFSIDLMSACEALGEITGAQAGEDLVNEIFSKFCMGK